MSGTMQDELSARARRASKAVIDPNAMLHDAFGAAESASGSPCSAVLGCPG
jgi:hypothetical protein